MLVLSPTCPQSVCASFSCPACNNKMIKNGFTGAGKQRYRCHTCNKSRLLQYIYNACNPGITDSIIALLKEGNGVRSTARLVSINKDTVVRVIRKVAARLRKPLVSFGQSFEMDELRTFIGTKEKPIWVAYALRRDTREVADFRVGNRTNRTLSGLVDTLLLSNAKAIHTDKLINYRSLIPPAIHKTKAYGINHIERKNLTLRTHLKRLSRRTIAFSKSQSMLEACLKIYFWG